MKGKGDGNPATEEEGHSLEGIRRLLLQVEAVHAVSWLLVPPPSSVPSWGGYTRFAHDHLGTAEDDAADSEAKDRNAWCTIGSHVQVGDRLDVPSLFYSMTLTAA